MCSQRQTRRDPGRDGERHQAVIVFADVVGYSRLMADDEPGTLNRWTALSKDLLKPETERRRGQVCELRGDSSGHRVPIREGLFGDAVSVAARLQQHAALRRARRGGARARSTRSCCRLRIRAVTSTSDESRSRTAPAATCRRPFARRVSAATRIRATRPTCGISSRHSSIRAALPRPESPAI